LLALKLKFALAVSKPGLRLNFLSLKNRSDSSGFLVEIVRILRPLAAGSTSFDILES